MLGSSDVEFRNNPWFVDSADGVLKIALFDVDQIDVDEPREVVEIDLRLGERGRRRQRDE